MVIEFFSSPSVVRGEIQHRAGKLWGGRAVGDSECISTTALCWDQDRAAFSAVVLALPLSKSPRGHSCRK